MLSPEGQAAFASVGFRPHRRHAGHASVEGANDPADPFPASDHLLTIDDDFGGWIRRPATKFFNEDDGIVTLIQQETGNT